MDEKLSQLIASINIPVDAQAIPSKAVFFRIIPNQMRDKKRHVPSAACFGYKPQAENDGLSVNWEDYSTPELTLSILGKSFRINSSEFKDPRSFCLYRIDRQFLNELEGIKDVRHDPVFHGKVPPVGSPNNPAHSLIEYIEPNDPEIRLKLQNHASPVEVDMGMVDEILNTIR